MNNNIHGIVAVVLFGVSLPLILPAQENTIILKEQEQRVEVVSDATVEGKKVYSVRLGNDRKEIWSLTDKKAFIGDDIYTQEDRAIDAVDFFDVLEIEENQMLVLFSEDGEVKVQRLIKAEEKYETDEPVSVTRQLSNMFDVVAGDITEHDSGIHVKLVGASVIPTIKRWESVGPVGNMKEFNQIDGRVKTDVPLFFAAAESEKDLERFLKEGFDINAKCRKEDNCTLLMIAARLGKVDMIERIVGLGGDLNVTDGEGRSVFDWAVKNGHREAISKLSELGGKLGKGLVHRAVAYTNDAELIVLLKQLGADLEEVGLAGQTPLMQAAAGGKLVFVKKLLELGCKADTETGNGKSALDFARERSRNSVVIKALQGKTE